MLEKRSSIIDELLRSSHSFFYLDLDQPGLQHPFENGCEFPVGEVLCHFFYIFSTAEAQLASPLSISLYLCLSRVMASMTRKQSLRRTHPQDNYCFSLLKEPRLCVLRCYLTSFLMPTFQPISDTNR
jgi:hypothetical protein